MLIVSFAWTTAALLATWPDGSDVKTCTRRNWNDEYARRFRAGIDCQGWDRGPRVGGQKVAEIRLTADAQPQRTSFMTEVDYKAEGLLWMEVKGITVRGQHPRVFFDQWRKADELVYVVRFRVVKRLAVHLSRKPLL